MVKVSPGGAQNTVFPSKVQLSSSFSVTSDRSVIIRSSAMAILEVWK